MKLVELTESNFDEEVKSAETVLVDFWAAWCGPCQMQGPIVDELAQARDDVKVCKVNVDEAGTLASRYQVTSIPSLVFFKKGEMVKKVVGVHSMEEIEEILTEISQ
jgi:thioredoxin 1